MIGELAMIQGKKVSVIIPACNVENSLAQCLDSVFSQTLKAHAVIVVNDGSTDGTSKVASSYGNKIIYLEQANQGQGAARNRGLEIAEGDYVAFLDADDYWRDEFLEECVRFLIQHQEAVAVSTGQTIIYGDGRRKLWPSCLSEKDYSQEPKLLKDFFEFWAEQDHVRTGSVLLRRDVIKKAGYQRADLRVSQDLEYWGYIATFGQWGFIPKPLWVGNSQAASVEKGWFEKYKLRRRLCPTVESWEIRIIPRLKEFQVAGFKIARGRVAANFAQNKILSGNLNEALEIVKKYGAEMPRTRLTMLMATGSGLGLVGWRVVCWVVQTRELLKVRRLRFFGRFPVRIR